MKIKVLHNQTLLDLAIQYTGSVENAFMIAGQNNLAVSSYLVAGYELQIPEGTPFNRDIYDYYSAKQLKPATSYADTSAETARGIGYMRIGGTFKVR